MIDLQLAGGSLCQLSLEAYKTFSVLMREYYQRLY
nr:MAG TPA: hypothetical protein [Caudoviricetes sp.]